MRNTDFTCERPSYAFEMVREPRRVTIHEFWQVQCTCKMRKQIVQQILENHDGLHKDGINPAQGPAGKPRDEPQDSNSCSNSMSAGGGAGKLQIAPSVCLSKL